MLQKHPTPCKFLWPWGQLRL